MSGWSICKNQKIPRLVTHHGSWREVSKHLAPKANSIKKWIANKVLLYLINGGFEWLTSRNALNVGVSSAVSRELFEQYHHLDSYSIQNGIDTELFENMNQSLCREKYNISRDDFIVYIVVLPALLLITTA